MKVLLDENFPLGLVPVLQADGLQVEHVITLGWRGASDTQIRTRLSEADLIFLTQDDDFLLGGAVASIVVVSRVRQARRLADRIQVWCAAVRQLLDGPPPQRRFELTDEGILVPYSTPPM